MRVKVRGVIMRRAGASVSPASSAKMRWNTPILLGVPVQSAEKSPQGFWTLHTRNRQDFGMAWMNDAYFNDAITFLRCTELMDRL